ncbi:site-specific integrase [Klebsiella quasipneumoniae subsp. quasipneumoniae]|nr:site-specific integrase [Klebsiella quasipneumoniae subsp. quasipneumoniae]TBP64037.1 site-specific integrase [Klebsiella quasipneumoniae subsp. quasipneumoniae]TBP97815.1 site-specific integrase [Klebsiella quasipneumoniae subsp. quasipneumoniae]TBQ62894.1 site-specific integrase [Klebsiella quasipneumoniae subsp. quasipneumoniae]
MRVKRFRFSSGESSSILLGDDGMPMLYPNLFMTINHRNNSDAASTCFKVLENIKYLYEICEFIGLDIEERSKTGNFLKKNEMETLVKWSKRTVAAFREHVGKCKKKHVLQLNPNVRKIESARANIVVEDEGDISSHTSYMRVTCFANYIGWLDNYLHPSKISTSEEQLKLLRPKKFSDNGDSDEEAELVIDLLDNNVRVRTGLNNSANRTRKDEYKSFTKSQIIRIFDVVRTDSSENPWGDESVRFRNQLIINLLWHLGARRGELAKVRVQDCRVSRENGARFLYIRKAEDKEDKRSHKPSTKTLGRAVPINSKLSAMIDDYIINHRSKVAGAEKLPYLLIPHHRGKSEDTALSLASINKICHQISAVVGFRVNPHAFRHSWNDAYSKMADGKIKSGKSTEAKTESDRRKLMGWHEGSKMAQRYSKRHDSKRAFQSGLELQENGVTEVDNIVGGYDEDILM